MSHNVMPKTAAADDEEVCDIREQGIVGQQHVRRFQAGDDDTEAPPVPKRPNLEAPNPPARAMRTTYDNKDEEEVAPTSAAYMQARQSAPQHAPAEPEATPSHHVTATAASYPPPPASTPVDEPTTSLAPQHMTVQPGAIPIRGPGLRFSWRRGQSVVEDQATVMTPIAEVVQDTPLVVAIPAPQGEPPHIEQPQRMENWRTKHRNQLMVAGFLAVTVALVVVTVMIMLSKNNGGGTSLQDATPPPTSPQTPMTTTMVPTTAPPTTASSPNTTTPPAMPVPTTATPTAPIATLSPTTQSTAWQWKQMGQGIDGEAAGSNGFYWSGYSVSLSADGTTVGIGASVYRWNGGSWDKLGNGLDAEMADNRPGHSVSLSAEGTTVAIGTPDNDGNGDRSGRVRIYRLTGNNWIQVGNDINGEAADDYSGRSISLSANGTIVVIGAPWNEGNGVNAGHVRIYQLTGIDWMQVGNDLDGQAAGDHFGTSVSSSADGTTVAIGADEFDSNGNRSGHVCVYQLTGNDWIQVGNDLDGQAAGDRSGVAVSLSADGTTVAIGAEENDDHVLGSGYVRVYRLTGNDWMQLGSNLDAKAHGKVMDEFGSSVSLSADGYTVAIGAPGDRGETKAGYVRVYQFAGYEWIQVGSDLDGETVFDHFGRSVSLSADGSVVAVGAPFGNGTGTEAGHVYVYRLEEQSW